MTKITVRDLSLMAIMEALLVIASKISFSIGPIPITLQTFAVFIISLILGVKRSIIVFSAYIIMGLIGIPVFSSGGGYTYVLMPSFGFIIGFLFASIVVGFASKSNKFYKKYILSAVGLLIINICGVIYMYIIMNFYMGLDKDLNYILSVGVLPFIAKDFIIVILSCIIYSRLEVHLYNKEPKLLEINLYKETK